MLWQVHWDLWQNWSYNGAQAILEMQHDSLRRRYETWSVVTQPPTQGLIKAFMAPKFFEFVALFLTNVDYSCFSILLVVCF